MPLVDPVNHPVDIREDSLCTSGSQPSNVAEGQFYLLSLVLYLRDSNSIQTNEG